MARARPLAERILDAALERADAAGWQRLRLYQIAAQLGVGLDKVYACYRDVDAVGEALLARADAAMLALAGEPGFAEQPAQQRIYAAMVRWLDTLAPHRRAVGAFLRYKFAPAHVHLQAALVVRLSRTVQWVRETAALDATGRRKDVEEIGLTLVFAAAVIGWIGDDSEDQERTREKLARRLDAADRLMARLWPPAR